MDINDKLLTTILDYLKKHNIKEKECLKACQINTSFFSDWKAGKIKSPSFDKIYRILKYLNISFENISFEKDINIYDQELFDLYSQLDERSKGEVIGYMKAKINN